MSRLSTCFLGWSEAMAATLGAREAGGDSGKNYLPPLLSSAHWSYGALRNRTASQVLFDPSSFALIFVAVALFPTLSSSATAPLNAQTRHLDHPLCEPLLERDSRAP